ncbi:hypothetical protein JVU11DRAFT_7105 [Chiua virens]|nr:hypothetical protein JVU11DRAFT_7105 [Chiua virens]
MVHWWQDPAVEACISAAYGNVIFLLLGAYGWEYFQNLDIEYTTIRRSLPFRWPLIPYLIGRSFLLIDLILLAIEQTPLSDHIDCQAGSILILGTGGIAIACSSTNFMIRTWMIWKDSRLVHILVLLAAVGHWTMIIIDWVNIKPTTNSIGACSDYIVSLPINAGIYMYTMWYDFLLLVLSTVKLSNKSYKKSVLEERLCSQHLFYFALAVMTNIPPTVFALLGSEAMVGITSLLGESAVHNFASCGMGDDVVQE